MISQSAPNVLPFASNNNLIIDWQDSARKKVWMAGMSGDQVDYHGPLVIDSSDGIYLYDVDGKRYIDAMSGAWVVNAGHGRREIADAMAKQASQVPFVLNEGYIGATTVVLAERLLELVPGDYDRVFFASGGSEAIETALKMVRQKWAILGTPHHKIIARKFSYHGATWGAMSVTGFPEWQWPFAPLVSGASFIPHPTCVQCPFDLDYPSCGIACATSLRDAIEKAGKDKVGAVIAEPISAASSAHIPPLEYWQIIRSICDEYNILLIADEIVTGFGRTGKWFGLEHWGIEPDILVVGKGMTSGYAPLSAVFTRAELTDSLDIDGFVHGYTFSGHPVSCAAALANIDILEQEKLPENALCQGELLIRLLRDGLKDCRIVGDIRGKGLLISIDIVKNKDTGEQFPDLRNLMRISKPIFLRNSVLCRVGPQIRLGPPLIITESECIELAEKLVNSILELEQTVQREN